VTAIHDFDWYTQRLDLARWEDQTVGSRSGFFACPVHGGSDSLHITEKNGRALLKCFACDATAMTITEALNGVAEPESPVRITRRGRAISMTTAQAAAVEEGGSLPPPRPRQSPLEWMAQRCGLTLEELTKLDLPLSETSDSVVFEFPTSKKVRGVTGGKRDKNFTWQGQDAPALWPVPENPGQEIVVCEGEADAICLRASGIEAYSVTKGAQSSVPAVVWDALRNLGVVRVKIVFDLDDAGRKGRDDAAKGARAAGLQIRESRVVGIRPLIGEKDARAVALRQGYPLELEEDADEDEARRLSDIESIRPEPLLLGRLHANEHTILFGDGGTGKGVIAAWWVARLTREQMRFLIVDYEQHARFEWRPRVETFGGDLTRVFIVQPTRAIWDIASWIRGQCELHEVDYVVVDSAAYACVGEEVEKSVTATKYSLAVAAIGRPTLTIAHVPKSTMDPNHPFGSTFWSNGARVTIAVSRRVADDPESPRLVRNAKTNQRGPFQTIAIKWDWLGNELPGVPVPGMDYNTLEEIVAYTQASDAIRASMLMRGRDVTPEEVLEDTGHHVTEGNLRAVKSRVRRVSRDSTDTDTGHVV